MRKRNLKLKQRLIFLYLIFFSIIMLFGLLTVEKITRKNFFAEEQNYISIKTEENHINYITLDFLGIRKKINISDIVFRFFKVKKKVVDCLDKSISMWYNDYR